MTWLDDLADPKEVANQQNAVQLETKPPEPSLFQGAGGAVTDNLMLGGVKLGTAFSDLAQPDFKNPELSGDPAKANAYNTRIDEENKERKKYLLEKSKEFRVNPQEVGLAGQILGPIADIIPRTVGGALLGGPLLGAAAAGFPEFEASKQVAMDEGIDSKTSTKKALIDAGVLSVGSMIPAAGFVKNFIGDFSLTVAANVGLGVASRAATKELLASNGYEAQAKQYEAFDKTSMAIDAILGSAFFGVAKLSSRNSAPVDAALTENQNIHANIDTAPGMPVDPASGAKHLDALNTAVEQLIRSEPINVNPGDATFIRGPRGLRNNNPGNIRADGTQWQGMVEGNDGAFVTFETPEAGIRALGKNLMTYQDKYGLNTVESIINRYAPPNENNTAGYVANVSKALGVDSTQPINLRDRNILSKITQAIIKQENGKNPYKASTIENGIDLAISGIPYETAGASVRNQLSARADIPEPIKESLAAKYERHAALKQDFDSKINKIMADAGVTQKPMIPDVMKGADRAVDKIMADYGGNVEKIKDLTRATILVDNFEQAQAAISSASREYGDLFGLRNSLMPDSLATSLDGYRDIKMNMDIGGGEIAELQINFPEMVAAKDKAHKFYELKEAISRKSILENRDLTPKESAEMARLDGEQASIYEAAWDSVLKRDLNSRSVKTVPLREADAYEKRLGSEAAGSQAMALNDGSTLTNTSSTSTNLVPGENLSGNSIINLPSVLNSIGQNQIGRNSTAYTERGNSIETQFVVMDAGQLITSHDNNLVENPLYPQTLQPRDRSRDASSAQISRIENNINPELLAESPKVSDGAPIIGPDGVVESGNARTIAMRKAYESGKAENYREWLQSNAARFGLDPAAISALENPVLVRLRNSEVDRAEFARVANESAVAQLSVTEQARSDANRLVSLEGMVAADDGSINFMGSGIFIRNFMNDVVSPTEQGSMIGPDGRLSKTGEQRIRNAVFAKAYGDSEVVAMMAESTDANIKNILNGMLRAAPAVARLREMITDGARYAMDIAPDLVKAVREFSDMRAKGYTVEQYLAQQDMFDVGMTPEMNNLLVGLQENSKAPKRIADMINSVVKSIDDLGDPRQASMFDGADTPKTQDIIADTVENLRNENATIKPAGDLFSSTEMQAAEQVAELNPMMKITTEDGETITVKDALDQAKFEAQQAEADSAAFEAAVVCFTRTG